MVMKDATNTDDPGANGNSISNVNNMQSTIPEDRENFKFSTMSNLAIFYSLHTSTNHQF